MQKFSETGTAAIIAKIKPKHVFLVAFGYLLLCAVAIILIDVYDAAGIRSYMERENYYFPRIWVHIFHEAGPTEMVQWAYLGVLALFSAFIGGSMDGQGEKRLGSFWFWTGIVAFILLLEDSANISHQFYGYTGVFVSHDSFLYSRAPIYIIYMIIGAFPLVRYWKDIREFAGTLRYLLGGYILYGMVALQSAFLGNLGIDRTVVSDFVLYDLLNEALNFSYHLDLSDLFMDTVLEESFELIAAAVLLGAAVKFVSEKKT